MGTWRALRLLLGLEVERWRSDPYELAKVVAFGFVAPMIGLFVVGLLGPVVGEWLTSRAASAPPVAATAPVARSDDDDTCRILVTDREGRIDVDDVQYFSPWCEGVVEVPGGGTPDEAVQAGRVRAWMELDAATRADGTVRLTVTEEVPTIWLRMADAQMAGFVWRESLHAAGKADANKQVGSGHVLWMNAATGAVEQRGAEAGVLGDQVGLAFGTAGGLVMVLAMAVATGGAPLDPTRLSAPPGARWLASIVQGGARGVIGATGFALWLSALAAAVVAAAWLRSNASVALFVRDASPIWAPIVVGYVAGVAVGAVAAAGLAPVWQYQRHRRWTTLLATFLMAWASGAWVSSWLLVESVVQGWHRSLPLVGLVISAAGTARTEDVRLAVPAIAASWLWVFGWSALAFRAEAKADVGMDG